LKLKLKLCGSCVMQGYSQCFHLPLRPSPHRCQFAGQWRGSLEFRPWDVDLQLNFPCPRQLPIWTATRLTRQGSSCTLLQETSSFPPVSAQPQLLYRWREPPLFGSWYHFSQHQKPVHNEVILFLPFLFCVLFRH